MKLTAKILFTILLLFLAGIVLSNIVLKNEYEKTDKNDLYWNYGKILGESFNHLVVNGGNVTNLVYEQGKNPSVRVYKDWDGYEQGKVKAVVTNDTLFLTFPNIYKDQYEKQWLLQNIPVRIFSPQLLSVEGIDTYLEVDKFDQKSMNVNLSGKSAFELETLGTCLDSLHITARDSCRMLFEMSPDIKREGTFNVHIAEVSLEDNSFLDLGHAQIDSLKLIIADSSGIALSGGTMRKNQAYSYNR
jgi:hypothetical protein